MRKVFTSSVYGRSHNERGISFAVDGDENTCLIVTSQGINDFPWLIVDLGNMYNITHVYIYSGG